MSNQTKHSKPINMKAPLYWPPCSRSDCEICNGKGKYRDSHLDKLGRTRFRWVPCSNAEFHGQGRRKGGDGMQSKIIRGPVHPSEKIPYPKNSPTPCQMTRGDCIGGPRPCPLVSCKFNTYLDAKENGDVVINYGNRLPEDVPPDKSCLLDMIDANRGNTPVDRDASDVVRHKIDGHMTLEEIADVMNLTRERVRQIEMYTFQKLRRKPEGKHLHNHIEKE